jgi:hypothetical protein
MKIAEMTRYDVRTVFVAFCLMLPLLIVGCDPGVTIRQADSHTETGKQSNVMVRVLYHSFVHRDCAFVTLHELLELSGTFR